MSDSFKELQFTKAGHRHVIRYRADRRVDAMRALEDLAADPRNEFDMWDAVVLNLHIGRHIFDEADEIPNR